LESLKRDTTVSNFTRGWAAVAASVSSSVFLVSALRGNWGFLFFVVAGFYCVYHFASGKPALNEYRVFMTETKLQVIAWALIIMGCVAVGILFIEGRL